LVVRDASAVGAKLLIRIACGGAIGQLRDANQRTRRLGGTFEGVIGIVAKVGSGTMNKAKREQEKPQ
jgi:hypothetical protein